MCFLCCCDVVLKNHFVQREERLSVVEQQYLPNIELSKFTDSPGSGTTLRLRVLHSSVWTCPELSTEEAEKLHEIDGQAKNVAKRE